MKPPKVPAPERTMTMAEAATELGVSRPRVHQLVHAKRLPSWRVAGRTVVAPTDVENLHLELLESNHPSAPSPELTRRETSGIYRDPRLERLERQESEYAALASETDGAPEVSLEPAFLGVALALVTMAAVHHFSPKPQQKQPLGEKG